MSLWDRVLGLFGTNRVRFAWWLRSLRGKGISGPRSAPAHEFPLVTAGLVGACVMLFGLALKLAQDSPYADEQAFNFALVRLGANFKVLVSLGEWWRPLTSVFLHGDARHLIMNALGLWTVGVATEQRYGRARTFVAFVLTGLAGAWVSLLAHEQLFGVGASGAIFGLMGLCIVHALRFRDAELRARFVPWMIYGLIIGLAIPRIDNAAHIGGLVAGGLLGLVLGDVGQAYRRAPAWVWNALAGIAVVAIAVAFYLTAESPLSKLLE